MADMLNDGNIKVAFVPAIADIDAPTVTELTAVGVIDLSCDIMADGWNVTWNEAEIASAKLCEDYDSVQPGRSKADMEITLARRDLDSADAADDPWNLLTQGLSGFLVKRVGVPSDTAFAAADEVEVYPVRFGRQKPGPVEANSQTKWMTKPFVTANPTTKAVVAAGV